MTLTPVSLDIIGVHALRAVHGRGSHVVFFHGRSPSSFMGGAVSGTCSCVLSPKRKPMVFSVGNSRVKTRERL